MTTKANIALGLKENWEQFTILVVVNAFVGGMIGMERTIFPQFAEVEFGVASKTAILSFITAFGFTKAIANYFTGRLSNRFGRKNLLLLGWLIALPIPFMLIYAPSWAWVIAANVLLGFSQGLTWSSTVVMKIDLVGEKDRGFAMGLNEFAGYFSVGVVAYLTGYIAHRYGITPYPFYLGIAMAVSGFLMTIFWVKDTRAFVQQESPDNRIATLKNVVIDTTFRHKTLSAVTQAGLVNNLNDGMIWGLLPIVLFNLHFDTESIGLIAAIYPTVWGVGQLFTGKMADHYSKKAMLFWGMLLQGVAILFIPLSTGFYLLAALAALLGLGTALVYPTFLTSIAQVTNPAQRAESIGTFRLWRDLGYAFGAILSGLMADWLGINYAIVLIGFLTVISSLIIQFRMLELYQSDKKCIQPDEVKQVLRNQQKIQLVDVRQPEEYEQGHIPQAVNIALSEINQRLPLFDSQSLIVTICGKGGGRSAEAADLLNSLGLKAIWLCGGTNKWMEGA